MTRHTLVKHATIVLVASALGSGHAYATEPAIYHAAPERPDLIDVPGSIWLLTRHDGRTFFHTNPAVGDDTSVPVAEAPRDPLAPQTGIWYTTRHAGRTGFDVNPQIGAATEHGGTELAVTDLLAGEAGAVR